MGTRGIAIADAVKALARAHRHARAAAATTCDSNLLTPEQAAHAKELEADAHMRTHELDAALQCLDKAIFLQPTRAVLYAKRAQVYWDLCDLKSAMASYRKLFALDANPPQRVKEQFAALLDLHGYSLLLLHEAPAIAITYLTEAIQLNGLDETYWLHRALAHIRAANFDKALQDVDHCICLNKRDVEYFVLRAKLHWHLHLHDRASRDIDCAAALAPMHPEVIKHGQRVLRASQAIYDQARRHVLLREFADAITCLNSATEIAPDDTRFYVLRAAAHRELGEYNDALKDNERALGLHRRHIVADTAKRQQSAAAAAAPDDSSDTVVPIESVDRSPAYCEIAAQRNAILTDLAQRYLRGQAYELALNALNQAIRGESDLAARCHATPAHPEQLVHRGDAYRGLDNFQAALADYHRALELLPERVDIRARVAAIHYQFGVQLVNKAQFDRAELEFARAIAHDDAVAVYYVRRGDAVRYLEKHEAACADYRRALQLEPHDQDTRNKLMQYAVKPLASTTTAAPARHISNQRTSEFAPSPSPSPGASASRSRLRLDAASRLDDARRACEAKNRVVQELFLHRPAMTKKPQ